tara:strand:+ start:2375 stop:2914 length:540 start_codon:yes stop_codon:yes gene_type:complete
MNEELLAAGRITGCYGVRGWVRIHSYTAPPENFLALGQWCIRRNGSREPLAIDAGRMQGKSLVAHIAGVDDRATAESYRGLTVEVPRAVLPPLEEGDYYWRDLEGLQVWCREDEASERVLLGVIDYLIDTGANDVLAVKPTAGSIDQHTRLIPYLPGDTVAAVDLAEGRIDINWFLDEF